MFWGVRIYQRAIQNYITNKDKCDVISRKIYLSYPTSVFKDNEDLEFEILNEIAIYFDVPFTSVQVVGSAKTGYSYVKRKDFKKGESDLDIAIINSKLFTDLLDYSFEITKGYTDFTVYQDSENYKKYYYSLKNDILEGSINPMNLPEGYLKEKWLYFFRELSRKYRDFFKNINGRVYASQYLFEMKQYKAIKIYLEDVGW